MLGVNFQATVLSRTWSNARAFVVSFVIAPAATELSSHSAVAPSAAPTVPLTLMGAQCSAGPARKRPHRRAERSRAPSPTR